LNDILITSSILHFY
jgi:hypothetical protein